MHATANKPDFAAATDPVVEELNKIVEQAESLLRSLGEDTGDAAEAVRERVTQTLNDAKSRLAESAQQATVVVESLAEQTDSYVRRNPWQAVAIAAVLGGVTVFLISKSMQRS
jgi:ElaB/YqjD/DUF883 family membrane-anchored ribosome-binding protein